MIQRVISTERPEVELRELWTEADDRAYFDAVVRSGDHLAQHGDTTADKYDTLESITRSRIAAMGTDVLRCGIWDLDEFVGTVNMRPGVNAIEMGSWVSSEKTGCGYARVARAGIMRHALDVKEEGQTVFDRIHVDNLPSIKASLAAGYVRAGTSGDYAYFFPREEEPEVVDFMHEGRIVHATTRTAALKDGTPVDRLEMILNHGLLIENKTDIELPKRSTHHQGGSLTSSDVLFVTEIPESRTGARPRFDDTNIAISPSVKSYEHDELPDPRSFVGLYNEKYLLDNVEPRHIDAIALSSNDLPSAYERFKPLLEEHNIVLCDYAANVYWPAHQSNG